MYVNTLLPNCSSFWKVKKTNKKQKQVISDPNLLSSKELTIITLITFVFFDRVKEGYSEGSETCYRKLLAQTLSRVSYDHPDSS